MGSLRFSLPPPPKKDFDFAPGRSWLWLRGESLCLEGLRKTQKIQDIRFPDEIWIQTHQNTNIQGSNPDEDTAIPFIVRINWSEENQCGEPRHDLNQCYGDIWYEKNWPARHDLHRSNRPPFSTRWRRSSTSRGPCTYMMTSQPRHSWGPVGCWDYTGPGFSCLFLAHKEVNLNLTHSNIMAPWSKMKVAHFEVQVWDCPSWCL
jgi:hypothetical protein